MPPLRPTGEWGDRLGGSHRELSAAAAPPVPLRGRRVTGPMEAAWCRAVLEGGEHSARLCGDMAVHALASPVPIIDDDPEGDPDQCLYTWVVECPGAAAVQLRATGVFDPGNPGEAELNRLDGSDLWIITLRMPAAWRASYTLIAWGLPGDEGGRVLRSAVVAGPDALPDCWTGASTSVVTVEERRGAERFWVYEAPERAPLLILFDGRVWRDLNLPAQVDAAIAIGLLPPVSLLLLDSEAAELGVPGGQVDALVDDILPYVRARYNVATSGEETIISGSGAGGLSALWALALSGGEIGHAIAQSPHLWRFDIAEALSAAEDWSSVRVHAGKYEGELLRMAHQLAEDLSGDIREVRVRGTHGGHDRAWWRVHLLTELTGLLRSIHSR